MTEAEAARKRLKAERDEIAQAEQFPLRRQLLIALGDSPASPADLARRVEAGKEPVRRKLSELIAEGLVYSSSATNAETRTQPVYALTLAGRSELGRHLSLGKDDPLPSRPERQEIEEFIGEAIDGAADLFRRGEIADAVDRLEEIRRQCVEADMHQLAAKAEGWLYRINPGKS